MKIYFAGNITVPREKLLYDLGGIIGFSHFIIIVKGKSLTMSFFGV